MEARFPHTGRSKNPQTKGESQHDFLLLLIPPELSKLTDDACQEVAEKQLLDSKSCKATN